MVDNPFENCTSLERIEVEKGNRNYTSENGILYTVDKTKLIAYPAGKKDKSCSIKDSVTIIGEDAFSGCSNLESIIIPNSVITIEKYAFYRCNNLINIDFPKNIEMEENVFYGVPGILYKTDNGRKEWDISENGDGSVKAIFTVDDKTLTISGDGEMKSLTSSGDAEYNEYNRCIENIKIINGVENIRQFAFCYFNNLKSVTIPESVKYIYSYSFFDCKSLESIKIPKSVILIGKAVFEDCKSLKNIEVEEGNENYISEDGVLFTKDKTTIIAYPAGKSDTSYIINDKVTSIRDYAFSGCKNLEGITIPNSVEYMGLYTFDECSYIICKPNSYAHSYAENKRVLYFLSTIESKKYKIGLYKIKNIKPITRVNDITSDPGIGDVKIFNRQGQELRKENIVGTEMILKVDEKDYKLIVEGDITGDGKIDITDLSLINRHRLGKEELEGIYFEAGDVDENGIIGFEDLVQANRYRLGK